MQRIYENKKITLVGPISEDNLSIQSSLSYYMLLPFAVAYKFHPIGPTIGTAFYSTLLILVLSFLLNKYFNWSFAVAVLFLTPIFPLLQAGRWAWNPHYIPFWQASSLLLIVFAYKKPYWYWWIPAGLAQGLAIHNHWYSAFTLFAFILILAIQSIREKEYRRVIFFCLGSFLAILPFILFDIRHPPGLFLTRFIYFSPFASMGRQSLDILALISRFLNNSFQFLNYFFQNKTITTFMSIPIVVYAVYALIKSSTFLKKLLIIPILLHLFCLSFIGSRVFDHYLLPAVVFFLLFLMIPDKSKKFSKFQFLVLSLIVLFSIRPSITEITKDTWETNINRTNKIVTIISQNIGNQRCNVFVAASPDIYTTGKRYRELLYVKHIPVMGKEEYRDYECLFVISVSSLETIQNDPAYELDLIRKNEPVGIWQIEKTPWIVYKFQAK